MFALTVNITEQNGFFKIDRVVQNEGLYAYSMHNLVSALHPCEVGSGSLLIILSSTYILMFLIRKLAFKIKS
jgi:hypothetical protein